MSAALRVYGDGDADSTDMDGAAESVGTVRSGEALLPPAGVQATRAAPRARMAINRLIIGKILL